MRGSRMGDSPPGGWLEYDADRYIDRMKKRRREVEKKVPGKFRVILKKISGSFLVLDNVSYVEASEYVDRERPKENQLGKFAGTYVIEKTNKPIQPTG